MRELRGFPAPRQSDVQAPPPPPRLRLRAWDLEDPLQLLLPFSPPPGHPSPEERSPWLPGALLTRTATDGASRGGFQAVVLCPSPFASDGRGALFQGLRCRPQEPAKAARPNVGGGSSSSSPASLPVCHSAAAITPVQERLLLLLLQEALAAREETPAASLAGFGGREGSAASALLVASRRRGGGDGKQPRSRAFVSLAPALRL